LKGDIFEKMKICQKREKMEEIGAVLGGGVSEEGREP
jgi:hypothetical protein